MDKTFSPADIEKRWYDYWERNNFFAPQGDNQGSGNSYYIPIPPPNVTGSLHMGHAFQQAIIDALIRYHRMRGDNTLWQVGTDHAGIATQMLVERKLEAQGINRHELGRNAFIEKIWEWKAESGNNITNQLRRLGASIDWHRERFTMDQGLSRAVQTVFIQLYKEGLIYRGQRLVNWDPKLHTAISDLEVVQEEEEGHLWHLRYPLVEGSDYLIVATTRPETMLGDAAVAVHPEDERYQHLIGQRVTLPLCNREIPIIADDYVDHEFGTGCVKITPAHDFNDYKVGQRHALPLLNIFTDNATINNTAPEAYQGVDRFEARKRIIADLDKLGLLDRIEDHKLKIPRGDRSGAVIEPYLTSQWYLSAKTLAKPAIAAVENGDIQFVPKQWENTYFSWMRDIQDWCISRQLWWGHRIPAWYDDAGNIYVDNSEDAVRTTYNLSSNVNLYQDEDVLDTWFSSALWTFSALGWPDNTSEMKTFHPASVLVTGFDIIFFWVARMIMLSLHFCKEVPFHTVYVHGLVRDSEGQKMSKSKGNVIDPIDLIDGIDLESLTTKRTNNMMQPKIAEKIEQTTRKYFPEGIPGYGTDALRFTFYSLASTGRDIKFDINRMEGYRNFCNKIWNAARYVLMNTKGQDCGLGEHAGTIKLSSADRWIRSHLQQTIQETQEAIDNYRFDIASQVLYEFIWNEYCDWYLELSKPILWSEDTDPALTIGTRQTLIQVLETSLRLLHPLMPFISEEIWQNISPIAGKSGETIMLQPWPEADGDAYDKKSETEIEWLKAMIVAIRTIRSESKLGPSKKLEVLVCNANDADIAMINTNTLFLKKLAKIESLTVLSDMTPPPSFSTLCRHMEILVPIAGVIDIDTELVRIDKELDKAKKEIARLKGKLNNPKFIDKAPAEIVATEQSKLSATQDTVTQLKSQRIRMEGLR